MKRVVIKNILRCSRRERKGEVCLQEILTNPLLKANTQVLRLAIAEMLVNSTELQILSRPQVDRC